ncbi:MAG: PAS domain-containing protein [Kofleriaceae bacterium]
MTSDLRELEPEPGATTPPEEALEADLRRRLVWLMLLRTLVVSVVLGLSLWLLARSKASTGGPAATLSALIAATYVSTIVYATLLRRGIPASRLVWPQLAGDLAVTALLVYVTGAAQSAYTFFFALSIVAAGALQYRRGVVAIGLASLALMTAVALAGWWQAAPLPMVPWVHPWEQPGLEFGRVLGQNAAAIIAVGVLAYVLGDQLQRTTQSLASERRVVADLVSLHQDIVRSLSSGLVTVDRRGRILTANAAAAGILGTGEQLSTRPIDELLPGLGERLAALPAGDSLRRGDVVLPRPGGEQVLGMSVSPLRDDREQVVGWVVNFQDLTGLRALEQNMRRAERMASLDASSPPASPTDPQPAGVDLGLDRALAPGPAGRRRRSRADGHRHPGGRSPQRAHQRHARLRQPAAAAAGDPRPAGAGRGDPARVPPGSAFARVDIVLTPEAGNRSISSATRDHAPGAVELLLQPPGRQRGRRVDGCAGPGRAQARQRQRHRLVHDR